ncbi:hypothetical protein FPT12_02885 [Pseudomonas sp. H3(2019)]|nr:hypothetical protein FPT12_02885 [Pseudomonas sp. H3(2019)]
MESAVRDMADYCNLKFMIVPMLCVGMPPWTLRVRSVSCDAERHWMHSHAECGNDLLQEFTNSMGVSNGEETQVSHLQQ